MEAIVVVQESHHNALRKYSNTRAYLSGRAGGVIEIEQLFELGFGEITDGILLLFHRLTSQRRLEHLAPEPE